MGIESTLNWSKMTCINWTSFEMADEQPGCNCWICDHLFTWHPMWKLKKCKLIKKNIWKVILYYFRICFTVSENIPLFVSLNKVHAKLCIKRFILTLFLFSFIWVQIEREILSQKSSVTDRFTISLDTEPIKCYWWNLKS